MSTPTNPQRGGQCFTLGRTFFLVAALFFAALLVPRVLKVDDLTLELSPSGPGTVSLTTIKNTVLHCTAAYQLHAEHIPLDFAQQYCITNPACTAFSLTPAGDISICESTRLELRSQSKALSYVKSSCVLRDGVVDCSTAQSGGCYFQQEHTKICVLDVLRPLIADLSSNSSLRLCHSPREGLVVTANGGKGCEWDVEDWTSLQIRNLHSHALLVPDLLKYSTSGFLQQPRECLCHNAANGLVTGPYCGNQDCLWVDTREPGCYYRNKQTQECIGSLLRLEGPQENIDNNSKYLCMDDGVLYLSSRAHSAACIWYTPVNQSSLVNKATGRLFQEIVQLVGDGSVCEVVARATRCLCYSAEHGLRMTDRCTRSCAWLPGGQSLTLEGSPYQASFNHEVQSFRFSCAVQLQPASFLKTATDALAACSSHPMCTYVTYGFRDGRTFLCQGYFKGVTVEDDKNDLWLNAFPGSCQSYNEESAVVAVASTLAPKCRRTSCTCPSGTTMVVSCDVRHDSVCDSCPEGYCSVWPNTTVLDKFPAAMKDVSMFGLGPRFRGFNPAIGAYDGQAWVVVRLANNTYCDEYSYQEQVSVFMSHVGLCQLDETTMSPRRETCLLLQVDISSMINHRGMLQHPVFKGIEDPRLFVFNNSLYISGTILLFSTTSRSSNMEYTRVAMFRINAHRNATEWGVYLYEDSSYDRLRQKNWMPIVDSRGKLRFVTSLWPLTIVTPDLATGKCIRTYQGTNNIYEHNAHLLQHHLRGGAPFIRIQSSWLTIVHKRVDYPMGPIYTHYVVVIKDTPSWEVLYVSPGFRLPTLSSAGAVQDIQFAVGMMMKGGDMYVSFGVADCFSALAIMHDFWDTLQLIIERNEMPTSPTASPLLGYDAPVAAVQRHAINNHTTIRWEGPSLDYSSFAIVARSLTQWFSTFGLHVFYYDLANHGSPVAKNFTSLDYIKRGLIRNNIDHLQEVDIAVRLQWPLNLDKTHHAKKLVVYLPWEFYYIPSVWVDKLNQYADDVWVPTNYVKQGFVASGVSPQKVFVLPHGVDKNILCPGSSRAPSSHKSLPLGVTTNKSFIFLYESGALWRKGLDVLLHAFNSEFTGRDNVVLLVHSIYGDMEVLSYLEDTVRNNKANSSAAEIIRISAKLSDAEQRLLRDAADVYVMPTRAEGYGLTIAEAMACSLPVITTDQGAHTEFIDESTGLLVKSTRTSCDKYPCFSKKEGVSANVFGLAMDNDPIWFEPDVTDLRMKLRMAYMKPDVLKVKATRARDQILKTSKWRDIAKHAADRLHTLLDMNKN